PIVGAADAASFASLRRQLHRGLEEVHVQAQGAVELAQLPIGAFSLETIVADEVADDRAVLLLDEALIVLAGDATPGEADRMLLAVGHQLGVEELAAVVGVEATDREGEQALGAIEGGEDRVLGAIKQGQALGP